MRGFPGDAPRSRGNSAYHEGLKVNPAALAQRIRISHLFYELAHGIARAFMVHSLVLRSPIFFMVGVFNLYSSVPGGSVVSTNC